MAVSDISENGDVTSFLWIIKDFENRSIGNFDEVKYCTFKVNNMWKFSCQLCFWHRCKLSSNFIMKPVLMLEDSDSDLSLSCFIKFYILDSELRERNTAQKRFTFTSERKYCDFYYFTKVNIIRKEDDKLLFHGNLILGCEITLCNKLLDRNDNFKDTNRVLADRQAFLLKTGRFSDFVVHVKDRQFPCHRFVLECQSEYFSALFRHDMKENQENKLILCDIEPDTFDKVLQYIYTGQIDAFEGDVLALLSAADRFGLTGLISLCEDKLHSHLHLTNVAEILHIANIYNLQRLKVNAYRVSQCFGKKECSSDSLWTHKTSTFGNPASTTDAPSDINHSLAAVATSNSLEEDADSYIGNACVKRRKVMRTSSNTNLLPPFVEFWCNTETVILAKSVWSIKNFTPNFFSDPDTIKSHVISSSYGTWQVELGSYKEMAFDFGMDIRLKLISSEKEGIKFKMIYDISVLNEKQEKRHICCGHIMHSVLEDCIYGSFSMLQSGKWEFMMVMTFTEDKSILFECPKSNILTCEKVNFVPNSKFTDVVIKVENEFFSSYKAILAYHSPYFSSKLQENISTQAVIEVHGVQPSTLKKLLTCIHSGKYDLTEIEVKKLIPFFSKYGFVDIQHSFEERLKSRVSKKNTFQPSSLVYSYNSMW